MSTNKHIWHFSKIGGVNRVTIEKGIDIENIQHLDQKLWTALSCPVYGLEIDSKTLNFMDTDKDGKIRVPEIIEAINWIVPLLNDTHDLVKRSQSLPLDSINQNTPLGKSLYNSALQIFQYLGKENSSEISIKDTTD